MAFFDWIVNEWQLLTVPVAVFIFSLIALLWLRRLAINRIVQWQKKSNYPLDTIILRAFQWPSTIWCVIISVSLGIAVSPVSILPATWKSPIVKGLWTLFLLSLVLVILNVIRELITFYSPKLQLSRRNTVLVKNTVSIIILAVFILIALEIWGVPTTPIILLIVIVVLVGAIVFRDTVPNLFAGLQLNTTREIKVGDYIKLGTGEEGYVTKIDWRNTYVKGSDESIAIIPNRHIVQTKLFNYGRPLKKAKEPFYFSSRLTFPELTGLKARNLKELGTVLKSAPDAVIYYHTHHFLEEHFYLTPEPANDFAIWVNDVLGDQALGERLASVDTVAFSSLSALRIRL